MEKNHIFVVLHVEQCWFASVFDALIHDECVVDQNELEIVGNYLQISKYWAYVDVENCLKFDTKDFKLHFE